MFPISQWQSMRRSWGALVSATLLASAAAGAQGVETPVPFDSAGSLRIITPALAARLELSRPAWPVAGEFIQARLYSTGARFVLVVERPDDTVERVLLDSAARQRLHDAIETALSRTGYLVDEADPGAISMPVGASFANRITWVAALAYGPALASLMPNGQAATVVYLASVGVTYFAAIDYANSHPVTRAQAVAASDAGVRGALLASGALYALSAPNDGDVYAAGIIAGSLGGSLFALNAARDWTDGEAAAASLVSTAAALVTGGIAGSLGAFDTASAPRAAIGVMSAAGIAGWWAGARYARRSGFAITAGDANMVGLAGALGAGLAIVPFADNTDGRTVAAAATVGLVAGLAVGDRAWARKYDFTPGEAFQAGIGATVGGMLGAIVPVTTKSGNGTVIFGSIMAGAALGAAASVAIVKPREARPRPAARTGRAGMKLEFSPAAVAALALRQRGVVTIARLRF